MDELSKTIKPGPERWIVAFAFPTLDRNNYFFGLKIQGTRYKVCISTQYTTDMLPILDRWFTNALLTLYRDYRNRLLTNGWPMICRYVCQYLTNTRPTLDRCTTDPQRQSTDISINMLTDTRPIYRSIIVSSKTQPICWRIHWSTPAIRHKIHLKYKT